MKRYCIVFEIKEEFVEQYCEVHRNAWHEILEAIKNAGAKELLIWNYKNLSILYYECEDLDEIFKYLGKLEIVNKWNILMNPMFKEMPVLDGSIKMSSCDKIFDLNQQLNDRLKKY